VCGAGWSSGALVALGWVEHELAEEFAGGCVDDPDVEVLDQDGDAGSGVGSSDADGVELAAVAQGDLAGFVDAVLADAVVGVVDAAAVVGVRFGSAGVEGGWGGPVWQGPVRTPLVVLDGEGVQQGLELDDGGGLGRLGAEPFFHGLLEPFDLALGLGVPGPPVLLVHAEATTEATWDAFSEASAVWGVPLGQLSDNGLNFSGRLRGFEVYFETQLRAIGVVAKTSRPYHPQTCGKVERFQQTMKKWLRRQRLARNLAELQTQLDAFVDYYNHHRPHRAIGRRTPIEAWAATPPAINLGIALPSPANRTDVIVDRRGVINVGRYQVAVGVEWHGCTARIHHDDRHAAVFINHRLVRAVQLDSSRRYQASGRPRGGTRKSRVLP